MTEVHARWSGTPKTLCGETGYTVLIRRPSDWELITCPTCHYVATKEEP